jgi:hypothetical protein
MYHKVASVGQMAANEFAFGDRSSASLFSYRKCATQNAHSRGARNDLSTIIILLDPEFPGASPQKISHLMQ